LDAIHLIRQHRVPDAIGILSDSIERRSFVFAAPKLAAKELHTADGGCRLGRAKVSGRALLGILVVRLK